jgi:hypothetical protein
MRVSEEHINASPQVELPFIQEEAARYRPVVVVSRKYQNSSVCIVSGIVCMNFHGARIHLAGHSELVTPGPWKQGTSEVDMLCICASLEHSLAVWLALRAQGLHRDHPSHCQHSFCDLVSFMILH